MPITKTKLFYSKRIKRVKAHLKKNHLKNSILQAVTKKPRVVISQILNGKYYPRYTDSLLREIENHFNLK